MAHHSHLKVSHLAYAYPGNDPLFTDLSFALSGKASLIIVSHDQKILENIGVELLRETRKIVW